MYGTCPECKQSVQRVKANAIDIVDGSRTLKGVTYCCNQCGTVLSVDVDPLALKAAIVAEIKKKG